MEERHVLVVYKDLCSSNVSSTGCTDGVGSAWHSIASAHGGIQSNDIPVTREFSRNRVVVKARRVV